MIDLDRIQALQEALNSAEFKAKLKERAALRKERDTIDGKLAALDTAIESLIPAEAMALLQPPAVAPLPVQRAARGTGAGKRQGIQVSLEALKRYFVEPEFKDAIVEPGVLSIRKAGLDLACIKKLAGDNPTALKLETGSPWPKVTLLKK